MTLKLTAIIFFYLTVKIEAIFWQPGRKKYLVEVIVLEIYLSTGISRREFLVWHIATHIKCLV